MPRSARRALAAAVLGWLLAAAVGVSAAADGFAYRGV